MVLVYKAMHYCAIMQLFSWWRVDDYTLQMEAYTPIPYITIKYLFET